MEHFKSIILYQWKWIEIKCNWFNNTHYFKINDSWLFRWIIIQRNKKLRWSSKRRPKCGCRYQSFLIRLFHPDDIFFLQCIWCLHRIFNVWSNCLEKYRRHKIAFLQNKILSWICRLYIAWGFVDLYQE